ncbi:MAG TPA: hypothetical protein VF549_17070 [Solirubrobacteraceae bacterium]
MRIETPFRDFLAFWERAEGLPQDEQLALWEELYAGPHRPLLDAYRGWFAGGASLEDALPRYGAIAGELEQRFAALDLERAARDVAELLQSDGSERAIAFVGLFTANAWMDHFEGDPTLFFALEVDALDSWHHVTAMHELVHLAHQRLAGRLPDGDLDVLLVAEGLAIAATRRLAPEATPEEHFSVADYAAWEADCRAAWDDAVPELLAACDGRDLRAMRRFFWPDWGREDKDVPERFGYYAGAAAVESMLETCDVAELAARPVARAGEVRAALSALA